jgi:hypothetical protein
VQDADAYHVGTSKLRATRQGLIRKGFGHLASAGSNLVEVNKMVMPTHLMRGAMMNARWASTPAPASNRA